MTKSKKYRNEMPDLDEDDPLDGYPEKKAPTISGALDQLASLEQSSCTLLDTASKLKALICGAPDEEEYDTPVQASIKMRLHDLNQRNNLIEEILQATIRELI